MAQNVAPTPIIENSIPVRYDPRVVVKPCEPNRVPRLPVEILYQIAEALPQPKQIYNLAIASSETWEYLQPVLYKCEVTYEARLAHKYGGQSSTKLQKFSGFHLEDSDSDSGNEEDTASAAERPRQVNEIISPGKCIFYDCDECDNGRINLEERIFEIPLPKIGEEFRVASGMTALHWASIRGASALPVAQKAIRAGLAHQPSYINGLNLIERLYRHSKDHDGSQLVPGDHPPPLLLAVAHHNFEVFQALLYAGADVNLLLGRVICDQFSWRGDEDLLLHFKLHQQCVEMPGLADCVYQWPGDFDLELLDCQTVGHIAIHFGQTEMLELLLQNGLNVQQKSSCLTHCAVMDANLAALQVLLQHDPSLIDSCQKASTLMHLVHFREPTAKSDVPEGQVRGIVSFLLDRGATLDAPAEEENAYGYTGETPLQAALDFLECAEFDEPRVLPALRAVNVFINMGSNWMQPLPERFGDGMASVSSENGNREGLDSAILSHCLFKTVVIPRGVFFGVDDLDDGPSDHIRYRAERNAWGQICKTIIAKASESLSRSDDADNKATVEDALSQAFERLVYHVYHFWHRDYTVGWWALEAVGNLLLSTGIMPGHETMQNWESILKRDFEARYRNAELIKDGEARDGSESEWAFLLAGVNGDKPEAD